MNPWIRCCTLLLIVALCFAIAGCAESESSASTDVTSESVPEEVAVVELGGLQISVETTSGPGPNIFDDSNSSVNNTPPAEGMTRLTVIASATNSTESTLPVQIKHNFPAVQDANGEYLTSVGSALTASYSPGGGYGLGPGGVLETVLSYDVEPDQAGFVIFWDFDELGTYEAPLP